MSEWMWVEGEASEHKQRWKPVTLTPRDRGICHFPPASAAVLRWWCPRTPPIGYPSHCYATNNSSLVALVTFVSQFVCKTQ
ncbi:hypothetical protein Pmani_029959 [Petrolisthes manimaculis]|uniref:Uncharacterized protein n=1 Tax=Petrolisthes manimaculis TaxID=1843537 RepID=A0AAE1NZ48_9EUCA|nr:hypothetical protein Pmani_029959 [Petrolisthes manimaculis]